MAGLFDGAAAPEVAGTPRADSAATAAAPAGPTWPIPIPLDTTRAAALQLLKDKLPPPDAPPVLAASARKITNMLSSAERAALEKGGPDSHLADALATRIALDAATTEGVKLYSHSPAASVDGAAVTALTRQGDAAAARLQKEANAAIAKGEVESLQMVTAASAALSRDMLTFRETADRLRGQSAAPRLGAGALDPDLVLPGQASRPAAKASTSPAPLRAELRDFQNLDGRRGRGKAFLLAIALAALIAGVANAVYFSVPHHAEIGVDAAGKGVERIDVVGASALVTVSPEWVASAEAALPRLVTALRETEVKKAVLVLPNGSPAGVVDVASGNVIGLIKPKSAAPSK